VKQTRRQPLLAHNSSSGRSTSTVRWKIHLRGAEDANACRNYIKADRELHRRQMKARLANIAIV